MPFCVPLLLLGFVIDAMEDHRRRRQAQAQRVRDEQAWQQTWFRLNGRPSSSTTLPEATTGSQPLPPQR